TVSKRLYLQGPTGKFRGFFDRFSRLNRYARAVHLKLAGVLPVYNSQVICAGDQVESRRVIPGPVAGDELFLPAFVSVIDLAFGRECFTVSKRLYLQGPPGKVRGFF